MATNEGKLYTVRNNGAIRIKGWDNAKFWADALKSDEKHYTFSWGQSTVGGTLPFIDVFPVSLQDRNLLFHLLDEAEIL